MRVVNRTLLWLELIFVLLFAAALVWSQIKFTTITKTVTTAGTRVQLSSTALLVRSFTVCAKTANTGHIYYGGATVDSTNGVDLSAGDCTGWAPVAATGGSTAYDLSSAYIDASVNGEGVNVTYAK